MEPDIKAFLVWESKLRNVVAKQGESALHGRSKSIDFGRESKRCGTHSRTGEAMPKDSTGDVLKMR
jgi:hypothetical protein